MSEQEIFFFRIPCHFDQALIFETRRLTGAPVTYLDFTCTVIGSRVVGDQVEFKLKKLGTWHGR